MKKLIKNIFDCEKKIDIKIFFEIKKRKKMQKTTEIKLIENLINLIEISDGLKKNFLKCKAF